MNNRTFLGFDFGLKRIGIAVGQDVTLSARPLTTLAAKNGKPNWDEVAALISEWQPAALVVGIPLNMDGTDMSVTAAARKFMCQLEVKFTIPVHAADERLTTKSARDEVFEAGGYRALQKVEIDAVAAKIILEEWMKSCG